MAYAGKINYQINLDVNQSNIDKIQQSLLKISTATTKSLTNGLSGKQAEKTLKQVQETASKVSKALSDSFNNALGKLNVTEFNRQLNNIGISKIQNDFMKLGTVGKTAFTQIATTALTTNLQLKQTTSFLDRMGQTLVNTVKWNIASKAINSFTGSIQSAFGYVKNLDTSLTNIRIVTGDSREEMAAFAKQANNAAQALGRSTLDYTKAALTFYQQGLGDQDVQARTQATLMAQNITGAGQEMADYLTAVWNGYKVANEEAELYVDKLAAVADSSASNMSQLAIAMSKVASTANMLGVDVDSLNAQIATIVATTRQAPESVGNALKTIYSRINDIATGADDAQISLGNYSKKMLQVGINVLDTNGRLRDTGDVIEEIGGKWAGLSREQQIYLARTMAGQRQYNNLLALFENWGKYTDLVNVSMESQGSLVEKNDRYMESLAAHLTQLKDAEEGVIQAFANGDSFKGVIDAGTKILNIFSKIITSIGGGGTALLQLGGIATQVFSKQIARELNNVIINFQNLRSNAQALRQDEINTRTWADSLSINSKQGYAPVDNLVANKQMIQGLSGSLSNEQILQATDTAKEIALLENQIEVWNKNKEAVQQYYTTLTGKQASFQKLQDVGFGDKIQQQIDKVNEAKQSYKNFYAVINSNNNKWGKQQAQAFTDLRKNAEEIKNFYGVPEQSTKKIQQLLDQYDQLTIKTKAAVKAASTPVEERQAWDEYKQAATQIAKKLDNQVGVAANKAGIALKGLNGTLNTSGQEIQQATSKLKLFKARLTEIQQQGKQMKAAQTFTALFGVMTQVIGSIQQIRNLKKIWNDDSLSSTEKMQQILMNIGTLMTSIGFMLPKIVTAFKGLAGIVGGPWAIAIGAAMVIIPAVIALIDKYTMSAKEAEQAIQKFKDKQEELNQSLKKNTSQQDSLKSMKEDWDTLSEKAGQYGKNIDSLTEDQKKRYFEITNAIAQMNSNAVLAYDSQGNAILKNNNALEQTIKLLKQQIKLQAQSYYTSQEYQDYQKARKTQRDAAREDLEKYQNRFEQLQNNNRQDYKEQIFNTAISNLNAEKFQNIENKEYHDYLQELGSKFSTLSTIGISGYTEEQINQVIEELKNSQYSYKKVIQDLIEDLQQVSLEHTEELLRISQEKFDAISKVDTSDIIAVLRGNKEFNDTYFEVAEIFGENALTSFIDGLEYFYDDNTTIDDVANSVYEELLKVLKDGFSKQNFNKLKEETAKGFNEISKELSSSEYEKTVSQYVNNIIEKNQELKDLAEKNPELLQSILKLLFPDLKDVNISKNFYTGQYSGVTTSTSTYENKKNFIQTTGVSSVKDVNAINNLSAQDLENWQTLADKVKQLKENGLQFTDALRTAVTFSQQILSEDDLKEVDSLTQLTQHYRSGRLGIGKQADQTYQANIEEVLKRQTKARQLDIDTVKTHAETLEELGQINEDYSEDLKDNIILATQLAMDHQEMNKGLQQLGKSWKDLSKELEDATYGTAEYAETITKLKQIMGQVLNVDPGMLSSDFIQNNLDQIKLAAQGEVDAIQQLRDAAAQDIVQNFNIDTHINGEDSDDVAYVGLQSRLEILTSHLQEFLNNQQQNGLEIGAKVNFNEEDYLGKFNQLIQAAGLTQEQVQAYFDAMGYHANMTTTQVPQTITHTGAFPWVKEEAKDGNPPVIEAVPYTWTEDTLVSVPQIESINYKGPIGKTINFGNTRAGKATTPKSSKSGGGSSKKPQTQKQSNDTRDVYHDVNRQLDHQEDKLKDIQDQQKKLLDKDRLQNIQKQNEELEKQKDLLSQKQGIAQGQLIRIRNELVVDTNGNVKFDGNQIANYNQMLADAEKIYNNYINYYNGLTAEQQEKAKDQLEAEKEKYDRIKKNAEEYEKTLDLLDDISDQQKQITDQIYQNRIALSKLNLQLAESVGDRQREWLDFEQQYIKKLSDEDIFGKSLASMKRISSYMDSEEIKRRAKELEDLQNEIALMAAGGVSSIYGDNLKAAQERLNELIKSQQDDLKQIQSLVDDIKDNYLDTIDKAQQKMDQQIDQYQRINDLWQHQNKMVELLYGDSAFDAYDKIANQQQQNAKLQEDMLRSEVLYWKEMMDKEVVDSDAWKKMRQNWEKAVDDLNSHLEDMIDNLHKKVEKNIDGIVFNLNLKLTNGKGLDFVSQDWDAISDYDDTFLDAFNREYGVQEIEDLYQSGLESLTGNLPAQARLNKLMNQQLSILQEKDKLTEYDIDRAKMLYQIEMKRFALEDAQANKTKMRLRRDSQGNYTYQYVADENAVAAAQKELADAQRELYNSDKQAYKKNLNQLYDVYENYMSQMTELTKQYNATQDEAERQRIQNRIDLLKSATKEIMQGLTDNEGYYLNYLGGSFFGENGLTDLTAEQLEAVKENVPYVDSEIKELKESIVGQGGILTATASAWKDITEAIKESDAAVRDILAVGGTSLEDIAGVVDENGAAFDENITHAQQLLQANQEIIDSCNAEIQAMQQLLSLLDQFIEKVVDATANIASLRDAYNLAQSLDNAGFTADNIPTASTAADSTLGNNYTGHVPEDTASLKAMINNILQQYEEFLSKMPIAKFDQGGYTGSWNDVDGRLAILHGQQLVLNKDDTANILSAVNVVRNLANSVGSILLGEMESKISSIGGVVNSVIPGNSLDQNVHIDASFPNVREHKEIEEAFNNLVNIASMKASSIFRK